MIGARGVGVCPRPLVISPVMGRGLPKKLGGGVRPTSQNPLLLFMTFVAGTVDLNVSYEGLLLTVLLIMMKK